MRPLMLEGAVSAMYTGTVTDAPPVFEYQEKENLKGRAKVVLILFKSLSLKCIYDRIFYVCVCLIKSSCHSCMKINKTNLLFIFLRHF